jgi:glycosyltransferase domain-containing protein
LDFDPKFYIADSSDDNQIAANEEICANIDLNVEYNTYSTEIRLIKKIRDALRNVTTSYTVLSADDDFITPSGIDQAVQFLSNDKSFSAAHGNYISFKAEQIGSDIQFSWKPSYVDSQSLEEQKPENRLQSHHANYVPTFYSVHRTPSIQEGYERAVEATTDVRFGELLPSMTAVINGKFKHLNVFYGARYNAHQTGATADDFIDFIREKNFILKYRNYRKSLADYLGTQSDLTLNEALMTVDKAMISFLVNSRGLTQQVATNIVKERKPSEVMKIGSDGSVKSQSLLVEARDWLQTTPAPERAISTLEDVYRVKNRYQNLMRSRDIERIKFYLQLDKPIIGNREMLKKIRQSVQSHPKALDE